MRASAGTRIDELHILTMPMALNFDVNAGADGFAIKFFAVDSRRPKPVPFPEGTLEIQMFDGNTTQFTGPGAPEPLRVWRFTTEELAAFLAETSIGISYEITPVWGADHPTQDRITVIARFSPPTGAPVYSAPASIMVVSK